MIVDDPWGRELAAHDDLEFHGTLWVLQRFHEVELLSSTAVGDSFVIAASAWNTIAQGHRQQAAVRHWTATLMTFFQSAVGKKKFGHLKESSSVSVMDNSTQHQLNT
ncbi:MAG: hypothetical protein ABSG13_16935 [Bryobacteraceae bacterium]